MGSMAFIFARIATIRVPIAFAAKEKKRQSKPWVCMVSSSVASLAMKEVARRVPKKDVFQFSLFAETPATVNAPSFQVK